ncbi:MAG: prepilin-type N-terminal cleavage/methylation domain-containing protein [Blautia sp.]|nr:prepilin-type N-terminal cleavage/methylation domain-containing protein [Blautia sp.]
MKENLKNKKGFTLVELIVVIVIILVLAAALVPNVYKYIGKASQANAKQNAATVLTEVQSDLAEYIAAIEMGEINAEAKNPEKKQYGRGAQVTFSVKAADPDNDIYQEVESFTYTNKTWTVKWTQLNDSWTIERVKASTEVDG